MELLDHVLVVLHLLGMAAIVGSAVLVARGTVTPALVWGARAQLLTGLALVGVLEARKEPVNHVKIGVKLLVALGVAACAEMARVRQSKGSVAQLVSVSGALAVLNVAIAVLWTSEAE